MAELFIDSPEVSLSHTSNGLSTWRALLNARLVVDGYPQELTNMVWPPDFSNKVAETPDEAIDGAKQRLLVIAESLCAQDISVVLTPEVETAQ